MRCVFPLVYKRIPSFWCDISMSIINLLIIMSLYWSNLVAAGAFSSYYLISLYFFFSHFSSKWITKYSIILWFFSKITWKIDYIALSGIPLILLLFYFKWSVIYTLGNKLYITTQCIFTGDHMHTMGTWIKKQHITILPGILWIILYTIT